MIQTIITFIIGGIISLFFKFIYDKYITNSDKNKFNKLKSSCEYENEKNNLIKDMINRTRSQCPENIPRIDLPEHWHSGTKFPYIDIPFKGQNTNFIIKELEKDGFISMSDYKEKYKIRHPFYKKYKEQLI